MGENLHVLHNQCNANCDLFEFENFFGNNLVLDLEF